MRTPQTMILWSACLMAVAAAGCARIETRPVGYATEPKTPEDQAVAQVLEGLITAWNERNWDQWFAYYAPHARIKSLAACAVVSREEHRAAVTADAYLPKAKLDQTRITMVSSDRSRAEAEFCLLHSWEPAVYRIIYDLIRLDGQWLIQEEDLPGEWLFRLGSHRESPVRAGPDYGSPRG